RSAAPNQRGERRRRAVVARDATLQRAVQSFRCRRGAVAFRARPGRHDASSVRRTTDITHFRISRKRVRTSHARQRHHDRLRTRSEAVLPWFGRAARISLADTTVFTLHHTTRSLTPCRSFTFIRPETTGT